MEFGERLTSPSSAPSSRHMASSSAGSSPAPPTTPSTKCSPALVPAGGSPLTTSGHLRQGTGDERLNISGSSNGFPLVGHPAFGLYASSSGRSEFGGLGSLGLSALAAHSQFGTFPDWWRLSEAHTSAAGAFFPPLLGLHPIFASTFKGYDPTYLQSHSPVSAGLTGTGNGRSGSSPTGHSAVTTSSLPTKGNTEKTKSNSSCQKNNQDQGALRKEITQKTNEKKLHKRPLETSSMSGSQSGSLSDSSFSDGEESSCDPEDEEEEEEEDDDDDQSNDSGNSDSENDSHRKGKVQRLTQNTCEGKKKRPHAANGNSTLLDAVPSASPYRLLSSSRLVGAPLSAPLFLQSSGTVEEEGQQHISVIQATGSAASNREASPLPCRTPTLLASKKLQQKPKCLMPSPPKHTPLADGMKESSGNLPAERLSPLKSFNLKQPLDSATQAFNLRPKSQSWYESPKNPASSSSLLTRQNDSSDAFSGRSLSLPHSNNTNLFLNHHHLNGVAHDAVQDAPLAVRGSESDVHSSRDSDDSLGDDFDDDDDIEDEESGSSLSESESGLDSDCAGSEDDVKEHSETEADSDAERTPPKRARASLSSSDLSANSSLLNLQRIEPQSSPGSLLAPDTVTSSGALSNHSTTSPSITFAPQSGSGKRRRVTDERVLRLPLEFGWQRETRIRTVAGRLQGEVAYFAPCGKKLRQYPDVMKYLLRNGITEISRDNFSFSTKIQVGDFYETREGPEGLQWFSLAEEEIAPRIIAMDGRRSRCAQSERQLIGDSPAASRWRIHPLCLEENNFQGVSDTKLLRKLEAQEIARQAAQIKIMRKLEKQAMAQAAKEARKQQAIMAAEEKRKKREQMKIVKQQEKIKRIQQIRMEKELRAQQILETKRRKKEEAANAKIMEAEKRHKEKEIRRLQAVILKHQELERHRLDMERERRRQHMMLMKAVEARKKAEEKERLKKEKKDEKQLKKERKLELRRLELEKAKELKKPNEDMCLADHEPLPELARIPGLVLPGSTFSECLMVLQFLRSFGKVLRLDTNPNMLNLSDLQEGLLNTGDSMGKVQDLLVNMLSAVVCDPGIPAGHRNKISLGDHLTNVGINRDNVSEILQIYMEGHREQTDLAALALSLRTKAFQAHSPTQKASMLAFLVNELCCSKAVISEIDRNMDHITNLRKDKWVVEGKLRKLRSIHAKKTGKRESSVGGEDSHTFVTPAARNKCKRKEGDSEEEEDEDDTSEDQGEEEDDDDESVGTKGKKAEICEEEDDSVHSASMEELEKQIEKTYKQQSQIRQNLFDSSHSLRCMAVGQDRYKRRYWVLPQCRGVFVEGMESGEGYEEAEKERKRQRTAAAIGIKEEPPQEEPKNPAASSPAQSTDGDTTTPAGQGQQDKDSLNLFLQKPGSFSKLSKLLEVAKMSRDSDVNPYYGLSAKLPTTVSYPSYPASRTAGGQQGLVDTSVTSVPSVLSSPQLSSPWMTCGPQSTDHEEQLAKMLMEKSNQWFSLLPRSPCDESSFTSGSSPPAASSCPLETGTTKSPSPTSPATDSCRAPTGINTIQPSVSQQVKSGIHQSRLTWCDVTSMPTSPGLPVLGASVTPTLDRTCPRVKGDGKNVFLLEHGNSVNNSGIPEQPSDQPECASFPSGEVAKTQDYPFPQPIPEDMLCGWWRVADMEELHRLVKALHSRGTREKALQKQIQKHMEYTNQLCASSKHAIDVAELKKSESSENTVEGWCVEEQAMQVDISLLQQVEALERKVVSARLQVKGWMHGEPQSEREDLVYHEHKLHAFPAREKKGQRETAQEELPGTVVRRPDNPLDMAVVRLAELERNIERSEEEAAPGMRLWRKALGEVRSSAQLSLCIQQLQKSFAWERSIMKVHCQLCQKGDNEELLLLCDGCDKGCHTYCQIPRITTVPDGDWFCPTCVAKGSGQSVWSRTQRSRTAGGGKKGSEVKQNSKPSAVGELVKEAADSVPKKGTKELKKRKGDDSPPCSQTRHGGPLSCVKKAKTTKDGDTDGLTMCRVLLDELEGQREAWPFLTPVNLKAVPGYRKVIKKPMDFSTIREKLTNNQYVNLETFIVDVNLVFDNCEKFNEDDSEIGQAGHSMRTFFDKRLIELLE